MSFKASAPSPAPCSPLNPHRPLMAVGNENGMTSGQLSVRTKTGASMHVRVVQEQERIDANVRRVRWLFSEGADTFQVELKHARATGLRKIYVNRECIERVRYSILSGEGSSHEFTLEGKGASHKANILITRISSLEFTYQLLIDDQPIQLVTKEEGPETPRPMTPKAAGGDGSPRTPGSPLGRVLGRRDSNATKLRIAEMLACSHVVTLDKSKGVLGLTVGNSDHRIDKSKKAFGVVVVGLDDECVAYHAGLRVGDTIIAVNGMSVIDHREAIACIDDARGEVELKVWGLRPCRALTLYKTTGGDVGVTISNNDFGPGVLVTGLEPEAQAHRLGMRTGDVVLSVNGAIVGHHSTAIAEIDAATDSVDMVYVPCSDEARVELTREMEA